MTDNSNAITDLLAKYFKAYKPYEGEAEQTVQALYEAVVTPINKRLSFLRGQDVTEYGKGEWDVLESLLREYRALFGVDEQGNDLVALSRNAKKSTANPPKKGVDTE